MSDVAELCRYGGGGDELPRVYRGETKTEGGAGYSLADMDLEIQRVTRELYKAFNGLNEGFKEVRPRGGKVTILKYLTCAAERPSCNRRAELPH